MAETRLGVHVYCRQCQAVPFLVKFKSAEKPDRSTVI